MNNSPRYLDANNCNENDINLKLNQILSCQEKNQTVFKHELESHTKILDNILELKSLVIKLQGELNEIRQNLDKKLKSVDTQILEIGASVKRNSSGVFDWKIDSLSRQQSDSFYTHENGYKMRLQLIPERYWIRQGVSIVVKMAQGANDKNLQWPVEFDIRIGIVNQDNGQFFRSEKQIILFKNSTSTHETPFKFTPYDLSGSAWKSNCLVIKCCVN